MGSTSKRTATSSVRYTFSDEDEQEPEGGTVKGTAKKKKGKPKTDVCKICDKKFSSEGLKRHMEIHTDTLDYSCDICDARFKTSQYLRLHQKRMHTTPTHECEYCGKRFTLPSKLEQHRLVHTGEKPHKCEYCGKAFRAQYSLNTHRYTHTNEKPFKCQYCPYACRDSSTLRKHHERHTGTLKWHHCSYCDKKYYAKCMLKSHVSEKHFAVDLKVIPCPKCDSKFKTNKQLNTHIKVVHERALRVSCEVCGQEVSNRNNMARHLRVHLQVRPYRCRVRDCNSRFKDVGALKRHSVIHKPAEQHACEVCGKLFARRHRLNVHMRRHGDDSKTNFKIMFCDYCGFSYDNKPRLIRHMLKHIRHKNTYVCDICKFITHRKLSIEKHMKYGHGDEDDRYCKICDKSYKLHAYLILHYYNRHGVRYKTLKNIKLETSVTIKEEPQEPIPDAEVDLEDIKKQEPLADIITDVALDCEATDLSYSKSVFSEDIQRSTGHVQPAAVKSGFRRRLRGRAALIEEQNTLYARKEKDVKKRINRLLSRVRQKKWSRALERARRMYNQRILRATAVKNTDKNVKVKFLNVNQANIIKKTETDNENNNDEFKNNTVDFEMPNEDKSDKCKQMVTTNTGNDRKINRCTIDKELNDDIIRNNEALATENNVGSGGSLPSDNETERDNGSVTNDDTETMESYVNAINEGSVRNVYEDVLDIEENLLCDENDDEERDSTINNKEKNYSIAGNTSADVDKRDKSSANVNDVEGIARNVNETKRDTGKTIDSIDKETNFQSINDVIPDEMKSRELSDDWESNASNLGSKICSDDNLSQNGTISSEENRIQTAKLPVSLKGKKKNDSNEMNKNDSKENSDSEENSTENNLSEDKIKGSDEEREKRTNNKEVERGKNVKLKINTHQCYICHKLYETKQKLLDHCQEHFDICTDVPLKKCPLCSYVTKRTITRHLKLVHNLNITLPYKLHDKSKYTAEKSRYCYNINNEVIKEIEIIPSVRNLNKIAYVEIDKKNRITKDLAVAKTKLVKKSGEWIIEHEKMSVNKEYLLPKFDKKEIKRLKHVGDDYLDVIKVLGRLAKRHKAKMLYPCNGCEKLCQTFAALKLHSRRHEANPKPFKKKVWKHKLKPHQLKAIKTRKNRIKAVNNELRQAEPKPIENKHKCDKKLMEFYEQNVKGAGIEFWQFLKIYNRMNKDHDNLDKLVETNEFGDYTEKPNEEVTSHNDEVTSLNIEETPQKIVVTSNNVKNRCNKSKVNNKFTRKMILSNEERLRRARIKEQLRKRITENT